MRAKMLTGIPVSKAFAPLYEAKDHDTPPGYQKIPGQGMKLLLAGKSVAGPS
jgi:hypothetical protein